jgi:hypothetical protein
MAALPIAKRRKSTPPTALVVGTPPTALVVGTPPTAQAVAPLGLTSRDKKHYSLLSRGAFGEQDLQVAKKLMSSLVDHVDDDDGAFGSNMAIISASNRLMKTVSMSSIVLEKAVCTLQQSEHDDILTSAVCDEMAAKVEQARSLMEDRKERRAKCAELLRPAVCSTAQEKKQLLSTFCHGVSHGRRLEKELHETNQAEKRRREERASRARHSRSVISAQQLRSLPSAVDDCESSSVEKTAGPSGSKLHRDKTIALYWELKGKGLLALPKLPDLPLKPTRALRRKYNTIDGILKSPKRD